VVDDKNSIILMRNTFVFKYFPNAVGLLVMASPARMWKADVEHGPFF
jgi:hypothetical protein